MVPINPATQAGIYPSTGPGSSTFDPYSTYQPPSSLPLGGAFSGQPGVYPSSQVPQLGQAAPLGQASPFGQAPIGTYPPYTGGPPTLPGAGPSASVGSFPPVGANYSQPGVYPNSAPSALFPGQSYGSNSGSLFGGLFGSSANNYGGSYGQQPGVYPPAYPGTAWNPQGTVFPNNMQYPEFIRLFQGPRFRHAWIFGNDDADALMINDSDLALAFTIPNFLFSTQQLYLLPSFSLHQWAGPKPPSTADLPALAYSAFLDAGWQSDPARILGAELGLRVGMFSDFNANSTDSLRIQGRGIGRIRLTPRSTLKLGVIYLDRNKTKLLPAGGLLWQPNQDTRFDLFFPEPKLSHYLSTLGTYDSWWYVGGYYGGGSWTVERTDGSDDSIDINDIRLVLGFEWGRNEQMREGRRMGFFEVGYVFDRELLFKASPLDDLTLQDTFMLRAGIGY